MRTKISAAVVADSLNTFGNRITSMLLVMPRYILAEFNTHRVLSRNSASSRAIPFKTMVEAVRTDPFIPLTWMKDHKGMQGNEFLPPDDEHWARETWLTARNYAVQQAVLLNERYNLTKQMCNRLLEPFMWHVVLCTASEWENFLALRANPMADVHMQTLAYEMLTALNTSVPKKLEPGEWHIPFGDDIDEMEAHKLSSYKADYGGVHSSEITDYLREQTTIRVKIATARAARTSYTLPDSRTKHDYAKDIELHDKLLGAGHMSPFEHCARAMSEEEYGTYVRGRYEPETTSMSQFQSPGYIKDGSDGWCHNFRGFIQYRALIPNENRSDNRLIKVAV